METFEKQTLLFTETEYTSFREDGLVNHSQSQEPEKERKMTAICGRKTLEQFERLGHRGSWAKTFAALLIGGGGLVFEEVQADLESEGYEILPLLLPAASKGGVHPRERIYVVAYSDVFRREIIQDDIRNSKATKRNAIGQRTQKQWGNYEATILDSSGNPFDAFRERYGEPAIFEGGNGLSPELDDITVPKWTEETLKGIGNAIVPQIAYEIFQAIERYEAARVV